MSGATDLFREGDGSRYNPLDVALKRDGRYKSINKFGSNPSVSTTEEDIWGGGAVYSFLSSALPLRVKVGGNIADTTDGTGCREIEVQGLDSNYDEVSERIVTAGASASAETSTSFLRVYRSFVTAVGSGGVNTGAITVESNSGVTQCVIPALKGQTTMGIYTIPAGYSGICRAIHCSASDSKASDVRMYRRKNAGSGWRLAWESYEVTNGISNVFTTSAITFDEKEDIKMSAVALTGTTSVSCIFEILLVKN